MEILSKTYCLNLPKVPNQSIFAGSAIIIFIIITISGTALDKKKFF
jgi:hypothetical protein